MTTPATLTPRAIFACTDFAAPPPQTPVVTANEPVPDPLPIRVRWALAHPDAADRSAAQVR
ncbi:MAG: hypothetical protein ACRDSL_16420 [Pseudonocardiaceae bacterium]